MTDWEFCEECNGAGYTCDRCGESEDACECMGGDAEIVPCPSCGGDGEIEIDW